jgi:hypothetical protein
MIHSTSTICLAECECERRITTASLLVSIDIAEEKCSGHDSGYSAVPAIHTSTVSVKADIRSEAQMASIYITTNKGAELIMNHVMKTLGMGRGTVPHS